jgi:hypothetical protein
MGAGVGAGGRHLKRVDLVMDGLTARAVAVDVANVEIKAAGAAAAKLGRDVVRGRTFGGKGGAEDREVHGAVRRAGPCL